jgi:hypothetical protein
LAAFIPSSLADATQVGIVQTTFRSLSWGRQGGVNDPILVFTQSTHDLGLGRKRLILRTLRRHSNACPVSLTASGANT